MPITLTPSTSILVQQTAVNIVGTGLVAGTTYYVQTVEPGTAQATGMPFPRYGEKALTADASGRIAFTWLPQVTGTFTVNIFTYPTQYINTMNPDMEVAKSTPVAATATTTITVVG